jgi:hypothetical protein
LRVLPSGAAAEHEKKCTSGEGGDPDADAA